MTSNTSSVRALPARPSLESLRKQAKTLARKVATGDTAAVARARTQLPTCELTLSSRDAQLVLVREYGFAGWKERDVSRLAPRLSVLPNPTISRLTFLWGFGIPSNSCCFMRAPPLGMFPDVRRKQRLNAFDLTI
jgi:hypothetical protein